MSPASTIAAFPVSRQEPLLTAAEWDEWVAPLTLAEDLLPCLCRTGTRDRGNGSKRDVDNAREPIPLASD